MKPITTAFGMYIWFSFLEFDRSIEVRSSVPADIWVISVERIRPLGAGLLASGQERVSGPDPGAAGSDGHRAARVAVADLGVHVAGTADGDVAVVVGDHVAPAADSDPVVVDAVAADDEGVVRCRGGDAVDIGNGGRRLGATLPPIRFSQWTRR